MIMQPTKEQIKWHEEAVLDGQFTADDLLAIAILMYEDRNVWHTKL